MRHLYKIQYKNEKNLWFFSRFHKKGPWPFLYRFYFYLNILQTKTDWNKFYHFLEELPDLSEDLEKLKNETKQFMDKKTEYKIYVKNITNSILGLSLLCSHILHKIIYFFETEIETECLLQKQNLDKDIAIYNPITQKHPCCRISEICESLEKIKHRIQIYLFLKLIQELLENSDVENSVLKSIYFLADKFLKDTKDVSNIEPLLPSVVESLTPLLLELQQGFPHEYAEIQQFLCFYRFDRYSRKLI